jgi:oligopeptidase B
MKLSFNLCVGIIILSLLPACSSEKKSDPFPRLPQLNGQAPQAMANPYHAEYLGLTLTDDFHWL